MAAFVDDMLIGTETEKRHDEIVEEVLRRLEENDLYMKPEKCVWKVQKVNFLGVVIGQGKIEMDVINPPEPKIVCLDGWEEWELFSDSLDKAC